MINIKEVYLLAKTMRFDDFEQELKSTLTGQPKTVVIDCKMGVFDLSKIESLVQLNHYEDSDFGNTPVECAELVEETRNKTGYCREDVL